MLALALTPAVAEAQTRAVDRARRELDRVEADGLALQTALLTARARKDGNRAACIDDALTRVHVAARTARALTEAIGAEERGGDAIAVDRDLTRITHLAQRTREVFRGARTCGVPEGVFANEKTVVTAHVPLLPPGADSFPRPPSTHAP